MICSHDLCFFSLSLQVAVILYPPHQSTKGKVHGTTVCVCAHACTSLSISGSPSFSPWPAEVKQNICNFSLHAPVTVEGQMYREKFLTQTDAFVSPCKLYSVKSQTGTLFIRGCCKCFLRLSAGQGLPAKTMIDPFSRSIGHCLTMVEYQKGQWFINDKPRQNE